MTTDMTSTSAFVDQTAADWDTWQALIDSISDERKHESGAVGFWSVKDTIAHITVYEQWTLDWLEAGLAGTAMDWGDDDAGNEQSFDERNAEFYEQSKDRTLEDIQSEAGSVHNQLMQALGRLPENAHELPVSGFVAGAGDLFGESTTILQAIDGCAADHYRHHTGDVKAWLEG